MYDSFQFTNQCHQVVERTRNFTDILPVQGRKAKSCHKVLIKNATLRLPSVHIDEANKHFSHSLFYSKGFAGSNLVKSNSTIVPLLRESFYH